MKQKLWLVTVALVTVASMLWQGFSSPRWTYLEAWVGTAHHSGSPWGLSHPHLLSFVSNNHFSLSNQHMSLQL